MQSLSSPPSRRAPAESPAAGAVARDERIFGPFDARVRCRDAGGRRFEGRAALDDVSAADFGLRLPVALTAGVRLFAVVALGRARVALRGLVTSAETPHGDLCRLRVRITHHRFLR
jgi:hypothetical protein